jgi:predicted transposase/invertase (TIGR01784 family)
VADESTLQPESDDTDNSKTMQHDRGYRDVFSNKSSFLHFLTKYIKASWSEGITEDDLEHVNATFVTKDYRKYESDVVYKMKNKNVFFYVLLELQSEPDFTMPYRLLKYMVNLLDDVFKNTPEEVRELKGFRLPAIVPIVLYNGEGSWTPVQSFKKYTTNYGDFGDNIIDFKYILFDLNRYDENDFLTTYKLLDFVFRLDLKHSSRSKDEFYERFKKLSESAHELTEDDVSAFIAWVINVGFKGEVSQNLVEETIEAFKKGDDEGMSYAIGRMVEKERKEERDNVARKLLKRGRPIEEIVEDTGLTREEVERLQPAM